jgi:hypothetical protein
MARNKMIAGIDSRTGNADQRCRARQIEQFNAENDDYG